MNNTIIRATLLLTASAISVGQQGSSCDLTGDHPLYSRHPALIEQEGIKSPDREKTLTVKRVLDETERTEGKLRFSVNAGSKRYSAELSGFDAEVTWSPDSSAFAVTQTEGGGGFGYRVYIFYVESDALRKLSVSAPIEKAFGTPTKCEIPVMPNTGFVSWLSPQRVLVAAEVVPVSVCQCSGMFRIYEVHLPDLRIIKSFDQAFAKKKFADVLGRELRDAKSCPLSGSR